MNRLQGKLPLTFSPLFTAVGTGFFVSLGLSFLTFVGPRPSRYAWLGLLVFFGAGAVLQFTSNRVLYSRAYDVVGWSLVVLVFAVLVWSVTVAAWGQQREVHAAVIISAMLLGFAVLVFVGNCRNPQRVQMPYGRVGKMNQDTGVIIDPHYVERLEEDSAKSAAGARTIAYLSPLIAGLTMLLARSLSDDLAFLMFIPAGVIVSSVATWLAASLLGFTVCTARWEREHGKRIYVER